jgi:serine O-acetyltransferase
MTKTDLIREAIAESIATLAQPASTALVYMPSHGRQMPSQAKVAEIVELFRQIIFPGYFGTDALNEHNFQHHIGVNVERVFRLLKEQIFKGICFTCSRDDEFNCRASEDEAEAKATEMIACLPEIRRLLASDVEAAYRTDPAARSRGEVIYSYPTVRAMTSHRLAHDLFRLGVPLLPRMIAERAHAETGIDIHPGADIGEYFAIDHGTGVVVGETATIGKGVKLYQGVTLGAKSFPVDKNGDAIKGLPRHPHIEDDVTIYANATILGTITIGRGAVIGGNIWVTRDVPPGARLVQQNHREMAYAGGSGI